MNAARARNGSRSTTTFDRISVSEMEAQNEFGRILDTVAQDRVVVITRHNTPKAVVMSVERFEALTGTDDDLLERLTAEFDAMLEEMQSPEAVAATRRFLEAQPVKRLVSRRAAEGAENG